jgi:hypothetical protein
LARLHHEERKGGKDGIHQRDIEKEYWYAFLRRSLNDTNHIEAIEKVEVALLVAPAVETAVREWNRV